MYIVHHNQVKNKKDTETNLCFGFECKKSFLKLIFIFRWIKLNAKSFICTNAESNAYNCKIQFSKKYMNGEDGELFIF